MFDCRLFILCKELCRNYSKTFFENIVSHRRTNIIGLELKLHPNDDAGGQRTGSTTSVRHRKSWPFCHFGRQLRSFVRSSGLRLGSSAISIFRLLNDPLGFDNNTDEYRLSVIFFYFPRKLIFIFRTFRTIMIDKWWLSSIYFFRFRNPQL